MEGRWTIYPAWPVGSRATVDGPERAEKVPVVPCDDEAIERAARGASAAATADPFVGEIPFMAARRIAEAALRAAGETP